MNTNASLVRRVWRRMHLVQPLVVAGAVYAATLAVPRERFSSLDPGERMVVQYVNHGCFSSFHARLTFAPAADGMRFTSVVKDGGTGPRTRTGILTPAQVARLDAEMGGFTRLPGAAGCSRRPGATVTRFVRGIPVSRTAYANRSCAVPGRDLLLRELLPE